jgi:hypothetical protein
MRRQLYLLAIAFVLATGAFWLTMLKDPPKSVASDPTRALQCYGFRTCAGYEYGTAW